MTNSHPKVDVPGSYKGRYRGIRGTYRNHIGLFPDDRKGLGYGQISSTGFNDPRTRGSSYPYPEPDMYADEEDDWIFSDDELDKFVKKINMGYHTVDSLARNKTDPFYYVAGSTTWLGGVSESGMHVAKNSLVPFPGWSKKVQAVSGGYTQQPAYDVRPALRTGTLQGWSLHPLDPLEPVDDEIITYRLRDILDDDELAIAKIKQTHRRLRRLDQLHRNN